MGASFKCFFCAKYFSDPGELMLHTQSHKKDIRDRKIILDKYIPKGKRTLLVDISELKCRLCDQMFPNLDEIRDHLEIYHEKSFLPAGNGMTEYNMQLRNGYYSCHICYQEFHSFVLLNSHINCHVGKVVCESCGVAFLNQHLLMKHREKHLINRYKCPNCEKTFNKKSQIKYHTEIVHKGKERVKLKKCPLCSESFKEHYSKMIHLKAVHGIFKTFNCHICKTSFSTRRSLTEHTTRHHTEKYKCEICSKCFSIESKLKQHMCGHTGQRNFTCSICNNSYMHKTTLQKHMHTHNTNDHLTCSKCSVDFHIKSEYESHMQQWHTTSK
nr:zinc finger protein 728-like [Danaus plexippus plexippus]